MDELFNDSGLSVDQTDVSLLEPSEALAHIEQLHAEYFSRHSKLCDLQAETTRQQEQLMSCIREQQQELSERLQQLETEHKHSGGCDNTELAELQQQLECALEKVHRLEAENAELIQHLSSEAPIQQESHDWESQKQRLLDQLSEDYDSSNGADDADRLTMENLVRLTDGIVADKCREVDELKRMLNEQSSQIGDVAVGAAAIGAAFDSDELIVQERENLSALQAEWKEKLSKAEVEISIERAKLANERKEMEEKLLMYERATANQASPTDDESESSERRRRVWLF